MRSRSDGVTHPIPAHAAFAAALFSDPWLADATEGRLRDDLIVADVRRASLRAGGVHAHAHPWTQDMVVLYGVTIEQGGLLRLHEPDRGLSTIADVPASLKRLRRSQLVEAERDGNAWHVSWARRALRIAREAGYRPRRTSSRWR